MRVCFCSIAFIDVFQKTSPKKIKMGELLLSAGVCEMQAFHHANCGTPPGCLTLSVLRLRTSPCRGE